MIKKFVALSLLISSTIQASPITVDLYATNKAQKKYGTVTFNDTPYGLLITPKLTQLPPGLHGFHLHQNPSCDEHGMAAGGHFDPKKSNSHLGPYDAGHLGDLPVLFVGKDGTANTPLLAPRLTSIEIKGLTVMLHAGGDNYTNTPALGGGGKRLACGVIK